MAPSLDGLPPEVRNMIWEHLLVSPTGYGRIVSRREARETGYLLFPKSHIPSGPHFYVVPARRITESAIMRFCDLYDNINPVHRLTLSIAVLRTCRQIYSETALMFWERNTFVFDTPFKYLKLCKAITRVPFRRLGSIRLEVRTLLGTNMEMLCKAMSILIKDANRDTTCLQSLELVLGSTAVAHMIEGKTGRNLYDQFLSLLSRANDGLQNVDKTLIVCDQVWVRRKLAFATIDELYQSSEFDLEGKMKRMHKAWAGRLIGGLR